MDVSRRSCDKDVALAGTLTRVPPCPLASRIKALVWHDNRMAEDVSRDPLSPLTLMMHIVWHGSDL
jgi:hypothetical protein